MYMYVMCKEENVVFGSVIRRVFIVTACTEWAWLMCALFLRSGCYLISGSTDGSLLWWDLRTNKLEQAEGREGDDGVHESAPTSVSKGHNDAVNGCRSVSRTILLH